MKEHRLNNWASDKDLDCLLFFALRIRELAFDYTLDSFKYQALNSTSICSEAIELINEIEANNVSDKSILPVLDELILKVKGDHVVKDLIGSDLDYYINFGDYTNFKDIKLKVELLSNKLNPLKYKSSITEKILLLVKENKEKKLIYDLTTNYITSLINLGFSQSYIYLKINSTFFSKTNINNISVLVDFFDSFEFLPQLYDVVFKCSEILGEIKNSSNSFGCEILSELEINYTKLDKKNFISSKNSRELYFVAKNIKALDPLSAKNIAENRINKLSKLFVFYHHKQHPVWSEKSLVVNTIKDQSFLINEKISPMSKGRDLKPKKAAIRLNNLIKGLSLESTSFAKYDRVIDLHGLSVQNKNIENQLLQNWIAFETLLVGYSKNTKIDQVINHLVPFLIYKYIDRLINELLKDINRYDFKFLYNEIKKISEGENLNEKFTALVVLDKYKTNRIEFYKKLEKNPLLKFRLSEFHSTFSKPKEIKKFIERHELKVVWQIKRMYRTRNLIVHAGIVPEFTEILVENSHSYLDLLISSINTLSIEKKSINSIEQAIREIQIQVFKQTKLINKNLEKMIDEKNYIGILLNE